MNGRVSADGVGAKEKVDMGGERDRWASASVGARTCADSVGARERWKWVRTVWAQGKGLNE